MENNRNRDYNQNERNPQDKSQNFESQMNRDANEARNASDARANSQQSPENGRDSNVPGSRSGSHLGDKNVETGNNWKNNYKDTKGNAQFSGDYDERNYNDMVEDADLIPNMSSSRNAEDVRNEVSNPGSPDEAYGDSRDRNSDPTRTPGL